LRGSTRIKTKLEMLKKPSVKIGGNPSPVPGLGCHPAFVFAVVLVVIFLLHVPLLQLPYFWDEAGYYVPAARDLLFSGSLIPHTTISNAHPPLVLAWIALWWKCVGYAPVVTRSAMLVVAAFSLLGVFRLAERVANTQVAIASTVCTAVYPVFFAQSSLAQVDLAAAGLTFWGLCAYVEDRPVGVAIWFSLAALAKETAILAPVAVVLWEVLGFVATKWSALRGLWDSGSESRSKRILPLLVPLLPLVLWYAYHWARTGYVFGNPEFFRYNVAATLNPLRFLLALGLRLWQAFGYLHLWLLTLGMLLAMLLPPVKDKDKHGIERSRIAVPVQMIFLAVVKVYVVAMALIGGAVLARYMLPAVPLVIIVAVSTLHRRLRYWPAAVAVVVVAFVAAWFWNPPYGFSPEDNLAYRDYIVLHQDGERFLEARYPIAHVLTAWPASDELTRPWLGYTTRPMQVVRIEDFSLDEVLSAAEFRAHFDAALVFSTKYEPAHPLLDRWAKWTGLKRRFFGFHRDLPPEAMARILGGRVVFSEERKGQWVGVIEMEQSEVQNAAVRRQ
jgi:Dolichyl-phosphate-mannose-protein mannosyltransferase